MHRALAAWLIAKPWRAAILTALLGVLSPQGLSPLSVAAGAVPVLLLLARDRKAGMEALLAGGVAIGVLLLAIGHSLWLSLGSVAMLLIAPFALASMLQRTGSLRWCFQVAVLGSVVLLGAIYGLIDSANALWRQWLEESARELTNAGLTVNEQAILASLARTNWGTFVSLTLLTVLGSLFLGCWWQSLVQAPGAFGKEFQQLRLGKALGAAAVLTVLAAFAFDKFAIEAPLIDALVWVATVALAFQGLAAAHRLKASGRVGGGWLTATYVLLIVPITMLFMVMLLAGWGVADNWRRRA